MEDCRFVLAVGRDGRRDEEEKKARKQKPPETLLTASPQPLSPIIVLSHFVRSGPSCYGTLTDW